MEKITIYMDRAMPDAPGIEKYMDFDSVFKKYQAFSLPFYKRAWFKWGMAMVVVTAGVSLALTRFSEEKPNTATVKTAPAVREVQKMSEESPCINPPVEGAQGFSRSYVISGTRDTVIVTEKGSKLFIPAGVAGKGSYELRIREFTKNTEVFLSGIPMDYDSAGQKYAFESAGMIEILAFRNSQPVNMEKGKTIEAVLHGENPGKQFNVYYLDTVARKWNYEGKDVVHAEKLNYPATQPMTDKEWKAMEDSITVCEQRIEKQEKIIQSLKKNQPIEPLQADTSAYYFDLKFSEVKFPQMKPFKKAHFQVLEECTFFNSSFYTTKWNSISVTEQIPGRKYIIHVERKKDNAREKYDIPVKPVYEGKAYDSAYSAFRISFDKYKSLEAAEEKKLKESETKKRQYEERIQKAETNVLNNDNGLITINKVNNPANLTFNKMTVAYSVTRSFKVRNFGIWNCDHPWPYKKKEEVTVIARTVTGETLKEGELYVCDVNKKAMFTYNEKEWTKIGMEKGGLYTVWMVDHEERLHYAKVDFRTTDVPATKKVTIEMKTLSTVPTEAAKLQKLLGI